MAEKMSKVKTKYMYNSNNRQSGGSIRYGSSRPGSYSRNGQSRPGAPRTSSGTGSTSSGNSQLRNRSNSTNSYSNRSGSYAGSGNNSGAYGHRSYTPNRGGGRKIKEMRVDLNMLIKKAAPQTLETEFNAKHSFNDFPISNPLKQNIAARGYTQPTPIQDQAIMPMLEGRDLIGLANTGTGKTAAFLIPIINKIFTTRAHKALIIAPTRELAFQITDEFRSFSEGMRLYSTLIIGGANMTRQIHQLRRNPHVVVATPGRLKDLLKRNVLHLDEFSLFVLDEVDLMVDIGFIEDIRYFLSLLPKERQSMFFSATINPKVNELLQSFVNDPVTVSVKKQDTGENIDQDVVRVTDRSKKIDTLHDLLIQEEFEKVMVFGRTKHGIEKLTGELEYRGFKVGAIHGNKSQGHRQRVLQSFKNNEIKILLATDVASRGLDIPNVSHVINYELPESYDDYVHRIGRTGRANKKGIALTFID